MKMKHEIPPSIILAFKPIRDRIKRAVKKQRPVTLEQALAQVSKTTKHL